jgi:uncharacterized protein
MSKALKVACAFAAALVMGAGALQAEDDKDVARMNAGAITLITDGANSPSAHYAADLAVLMEGERDLRILPVMGHGPVEAVRDLLFLRGIDASIIPADTVAYVRKQELIEDVDKKVTYVARLGSAQVHVIARKDIATLADLAGKNVNIGGASEPRFVTATMIFESLGITVNPVAGAEADAANLLKSGKADAIVIVAPQPSSIAEDLARGGNYRLLNVTGNDELNGIYAPAMLNAKTYDGLMPDTGMTETLSVSYAVAVFNWKKGTDRYYKLRKFADVLYSGIGELRTSAICRPESGTRRGTMLIFPPIFRAGRVMSPPTSGSTSTSATRPTRPARKRRRSRPNSSPIWSGRNSAATSCPPIRRD